MNTVPLSGWQKLARAQFPQGNLQGDGPFALVPCSPAAKVYLFWTKAEAEAVADHWPCAPLCYGDHKIIELHAPRAPRRAPVDRKSSYVWERDRHERHAR